MIIINIDYDENIHNDIDDDETQCDNVHEGDDSGSCRYVLQRWCQWW